MEVERIFQVRQISHDTGLAGVKVCYFLVCQMASNTVHWYHITIALRWVHVISYTHPLTLFNDGHVPHPTMVSHLVVVVGLCTDDPKDF